MLYTCLVPTDSSQEDIYCVFYDVFDFVEVGLKATGAIN